ncbi:MAG: transglycosylase domain-containing protein [Bacteroidota bacterium]
MAKKKTSKKKKKQISLKRKFIYFLLIMLGTGVLFSALLVLAVYLGVFGKLPEPVEIRSIKQSNASLVYSSDGALMGKYYEVNRQSISNEHISPYVRQALIATEDNRFFEHHGIDIISLGRVFFKSLLLGDLDQGGGSTISQQLAKNLYARRNFGFLTLPVNKIKEMFIASELEDVYAKDEILTMYLNTVTFGENVYGIEAAAWRFYNKSSSELNIPESATLVGMLAANTTYNPRLHPENAIKRRNTVFSRMHTQGFITQEQAEQFTKEDLKLDYRLRDRARGIAPYFRHYIKQQILNLLDDSINLETNGLRIYTTIDKDIQSYAEAAIDIHMQKLQNEFDRHWKGRDPWEKDPEIFEKALRHTDEYQKHLAKELSHEEILTELARTHRRNIITAGGEEVRDISAIDSLRHYMRLLNTGFLALDPKSGAVLAWVGGINFQYLPYDHVTSKRQAGSTFKPFVYTAALMEGMQACQYFSNEQHVYEEYENWSPGNSSGKYGGYYSMAGGLMNSMNTITAEIMIRTGPEQVIKLAKEMGVESFLPAVPSLALGTAEVSLLEMLTAYTGFANYGSSVKPYGIIRIEDSEGNVIYEADKISHHPKAFSKDIGSLINTMLQSVVDSGTASSARKVYGLRSELAGKTGTTQNNADGWFIGFSPNFVAGAWVGAELPSVHFRTTALGSGAHMALPIFARTVKKMESRQALKRKYLTAFNPVSDSLMACIDCPAYSRDLPIEHLSRKEIREFRREIRKREDAMEGDTAKKRGLFRKIGDFFRRKR